MVHCELPGARDIRGSRERCCPPGRRLDRPQDLQACSDRLCSNWRDLPRKVAPAGGKYFEVLLSTIAGLLDFNLETAVVLWHSRQAPTSVGARVFYRRRSPMAGGFASWRSSTFSLVNAWRWSPIRRCPVCVLPASLVPSSFAAAVQR